MVWAVSGFRLKAPPGISSSCISQLTLSGQRSRASWASQPQKSATLSPQAGGKPRKFVRNVVARGEKKMNYWVSVRFLLLRILRVSWCPLDRSPARRRVSPGITKLDKEKNQCIRQKTGAQDIVKEIKQYQEKWLQHVQRMDTNRLPKQALQYQPKGRRNIGRPRKRRRD